MKGIVEIYGTKDDGSRDLLYQEENMTTVGFSENIVDMLTTPSSISLGAGTLLDEYVSSVNYKVQAFSVSKAEEQFSLNLHDYKTHNLLFQTDFPTAGLAGVEWDPTDVNSNGANGWIRRKVETLSFSDGQPANIIGPVVSANVQTYSNPYGDWNGSSAQEVSGFRVGANTSAGSISQEVIYVTGTETTTRAFTGAYFSGTDLVFSVDLKMDRSSPPIQVSADANGSYVGYSQLALSCNGNYHRLSIRWDKEGRAYAGDVPDGYTNAAGLDASGGIKSLGGGWYRAFVRGSFLGTHALPGDPDASGKTRVDIYPSIGDGADALIDSANFAVSSASGPENGYIYIARPQLELGIHPTEYVQVPFQYQRDNLLRYSRLNGTDPYGADGATSAVKINYYVVSDSGGPTLSGMYDGSFDKGASAYLPPTTKSIPSVNPNDRELTPGVVTPVEKAFGVRINKGHNPACAHLWDQIHVSSYDNSWTYTPGYTSLFGRHLLYLGTYPNSSWGAEEQLYPSGVQTTWDETVSGIMYVHYLSANDEGAYTNPVSSTSIGRLSLLGTGSTAAMPDMYGFVSIRPEHLSSLGGGGYYRPGIGTEYSKDFSSTGEVTYHLRTLESKNDSAAFTSTFTSNSEYQSDKMLWNLFGGTTVLGLWGLDLKQMREDAIYRGDDEEAFPYTNPVLDSAQIKSGTDNSYMVNRNMANPRRRYKLYNKKVLTDNIAKNEGFDTSSGLFFSYRNLDLYWRLKFI